MVRIDKRIARKVFKAGKDVIAIPHKMNPNNQFFGMGAVLSRDMGDFDKLCNQLEYYNCTGYTGRYLAFYIE